MTPSAKKINNTICPQLADLAAIPIKPTITATTTVHFNITYYYDSLITVDKKQ